MRHDEEIRAFIKQFDEGQPVQVIELGGFGPGYELAIWEMAVRLLEKMIVGLNSDPSVDWTEEGGTWAEDKVFITEAADFLVVDRDLSGAQLGAACNAATVFFRHGIAGGLAKAPADRLITIEKSQIENPFTAGCPQHDEWNAKHA